MKRFLKLFHYGEKGFTLIELLIIVAILGILAVIIIPNVITFISTGHVAAANEEVASVETAAMAYYADNEAWPADDAALFSENYTSADAIGTYGFDSYGKVTVADGDPWPKNDAVTWNSSAHKWEK